MKAIPLILTICLIACTPRSVREAKDVVTEADSTWRAGQSYTDSIQLAQAYHALDNWQWMYPDEYVHSCYYYGRLLREKDNPIAAMQCFINATHSRSHDYQILGRVYSNMGDICRITGHHAMAYDMYQYSAGSFLRNGDSLSYYYGLNNQAFELAEEKKKEETLVLLEHIRAYPYTALYVKTLETQAALYQALTQYDSVVVYVDSLQAYGYVEAFGLMMKARAYEHLGMQDSALWYAQWALSADLYGNTAIAAYYILSHEDHLLTADSILVLTSARADVQKAWAYSHGKLTQAVQLLEQELTRKPDKRWPVAILGTLFVIGGILGVYVFRKRKQQTLLSQKIEHLVTTYTDLRTTKLNHLEQTCATLRASKNLQTDLCWRDYEKMCEIVNFHFFFIAQKLQNTHIFTEREIRLCILVFIGITNSKQLADMLLYSESGIRNFKNRTAKKLNTNSVELRNKLLNMATGE